MTSKPRVIAVVGPTASGKTAWAIEWALHNSGAVISADSRQVYAGMDIGTAKPPEAWKQAPHDILTTEKIEGVDHYLLNIQHSTKQLSLAGWQTAAFQAIDHVISQGLTPLLTGGTMLYADSVAFNYSIPEVAPNPSLREELEKVPTEELFARLIQQDPDAGEFIEKHHTRRIIRALEVIAATGKPFSVLRTQQTPRYNVEWIGLFPGWESLEERISLRVDQMWKDGLMKETRQLRSQYGNDLPLLQTMNYKQVGSVIDGLSSEQEAKQEMVRVNMKYAHRQMAWWKNNSDIQWVK